MRWHAPGLVIAACMVIATLLAAQAAGLALRDTDRMLGGRMGLLVGLVLLFVAMDVVPVAWRNRAELGGSLLRAVPAATRRRWPRKRVLVVVLGFVSFYVTYLCYRNLKGYLPFLTEQDLDASLLALERDLFLGRDPGVVLHDILGTGVAAHVLSAVYLFFLAFIPISLGITLIASPNPIPGLWYVTALSINWAVGLLCYYAVPSMGPVFYAPELFSSLPDTGVTALQQSLLAERSESLANPDMTGSVSSIGAFASLHVSIVFTAAIMAQLLGLHRAIRYALWTFLAATFVATLYFGWHYVVDDVAGLAIGGTAVYTAGLATGLLRPALPARAKATA